MFEGRLSGRAVPEGGGGKPGPHGADIDGIHSGGADGFHAQIGVFESATAGGFDPDAAGGFEEDVGCGLLAGDILVGHDGIEPVADAQFFEDMPDGVA